VIKISNSFFNLNIQNLNELSYNKGSISDLFLSIFLNLINNQFSENQNSLENLSISKIFNANLNETLNQYSNLMEKSYENKYLDLISLYLFYIFNNNEPGSLDERNLVDSELNKIDEIKNFQFDGENPLFIKKLISFLLNHKEIDFSQLNQIFEKALSDFNTENITNKEGKFSQILNISGDEEFNKGKILIKGNGEWLGATGQNESEEEINGRVLNIRGEFSNFILSDNDLEVKKGGILKGGLKFYNPLERKFKVEENDFQEIFDAGLMKGDFRMENVVKVDYSKAIDFHRFPEGFWEMIKEMSLEIQPEGERRAFIKLEPPEMGFLDLEIKVKDKNIGIIVRVEKPELLQEIRQSLDLIKAGLEDSGFNLKEIQLFLGSNFNDKNLVKDFSKENITDRGINLIKGNGEWLGATGQNESEEEINGRVLNIRGEFSNFILSDNDLEVKKGGILKGGLKFYNPLERKFKVEENDFQEIFDAGLMKGDFRMENVVKVDYSKAIDFHRFPEGFWEMIKEMSLEIQPEGERRAFIKLEPPEMGFLDLEIKVKDKNIGIIVRVEKPELLQEIRQSLDLIKAGLEDSGFNLKEIQLFLGSNFNDKNLVKDFSKEKRNYSQKTEVEDVKEIDKKALKNKDLLKFYNRNGKYYYIV
jgi:DNA-binding transcriptional MerR regulator